MPVPFFSHSLSLSYPATLFIHLLNGHLSRLPMVLSGATGSTLLIHLPFNLLLTVRRFPFAFQRISPIFYLWIYLPLSRNYFTPVDVHKIASLRILERFK